MVEKREIWLCVLLCVLTCGLYAYYWMYKMNEEVNYLANDTESMSGVMVCVLALVTCGIYTYYWMYTLGQKLDSVCAGKGLPTQNRAVTYLVLPFFGLGLATYALAQETVNNLNDMGLVD